MSNDFEMKTVPLEPGHILDSSRPVSIPMMHLPIFRSTVAIQAGVQNKLLFKTWGGLGDQICAEPTLRHVLKTFKGVEVSLASEKPFLFKHLNFHRVFDVREVVPNWKQFFVFDTITAPDDSNLVWQFFSHLLTNCVDFPSLCAIRCQLPVQEREIFMTPKLSDTESAQTIQKLNHRNTVLIHAGRHWMTKTFPKVWWDGVITELLKNGIVPVLIGANTEDNRGTVDVDASLCLDLRNRLSIEDSLWLCQRAHVLLTNDSSPLHMAASRNPDDLTTGKTWIGYVATCKHPDYITHFRRAPNGDLVWQYREENLGLGGIWEIINPCPNQVDDVNVDQVDPEILNSWLPKPEKVAEWTLNKLNLD